MRIAFVAEDNNDPQKVMGAIERRRLFALIPYWVKDGCEVFPWKKDIDCDVIYIVNLPAMLEMTAQVFAHKKTGQAVVIGMIEDFDTERWASICDESIDDIVSLIAANNTAISTIRGRLRNIKNWIAELGFIQTPRTKIQKYIKYANAVLCTSELQAASLRRYNPYVNGVADCIPENDYIITDAIYFESLVEQKVSNNTVVLVWEGTAWGLQLLELIRKPINSIVEKTNLKICLRLIMPKYRPILFGETDNEIILKNRYLCAVELYDWNLQTVGALVKSADIGLAPQPLINPFYRAKAFSKPLVYMAAGLPVIASKIPSYCELIQNEINGFTVETDDEWQLRLLQLISNKELRIKMGLAAKQRVDEFHSVEKVATKIKNVFETSIKIARQ